MKKKNFVLLSTLTLVLIIVGFLIVLLMPFGGGKENIYRVGQIEMREYDVASKIPGRVEWINVDEGDYVQAGDSLLKLTDRELEAKYMQAEGAVFSAKAQLNMALNGARKEEVEMARRSFDAAESQYDLAEKTYARLKSLSDDKLLSAQDLDVAFQKLSAARAQKQAAQSQLNMAVIGSRSEQKDMARGQLMRAEESRQEVNTYLDESIIKCPIAGIVAKRYADKGELLAVGYPALTIIDPADVWLEINLPAKELEVIKIGDVLEGRIDGLGIEEKFKVKNFSALSDFANWRSTSDKANFDVRTFTVKLIPLNKNINSLRPGMTVRLKLK